MAIIIKKDVGIYTPVEQVYVRISKFSADIVNENIEVEFSLYFGREARKIESIKQFIEQRAKEEFSPVEYDEEIASQFQFSVEDFHRVFDKGPWNLEEWVQIYESYFILQGQPMQKFTLFRDSRMLSDIDFSKLDVTWAYNQMTEGGIFQGAIETPGHIEWIRETRQDNFESMMDFIKEEAIKFPILLKNYQE